MSYKSFLIGLILLTFMSVTAMAEGGFSGRIDYTDCNCNAGDQVSITPDGGSTYYYSVSCHKWYYGSYATSRGTPATFPPGWYTVTLHLGPSSGCPYGDSRYVYHGTSSTRLNLEVPGP